MWISDAGNRSLASAYWRRSRTSRLVTPSGWRQMLAPACRGSASTSLPTLQRTFLAQAEALPTYCECHIIKHHQASSRVWYFDLFLGSWKQFTTCCFTNRIISPNVVLWPLLVVCQSITYCACCKGWNFWAVQYNLLNTVQLYLTQIRFHFVLSIKS